MSNNCKSCTCFHFRFPICFCIFFIDDYLIIFFLSRYYFFFSSSSVHCDTTIKRKKRKKRKKRISCQNNQNTLSPLASILITQVYLLLWDKFNTFTKQTYKLEIFRFSLKKSQVLSYDLLHKNLLSVLHI